MYRIYKISDITNDNLSLDFDLLSSILLRHPSFQMTSSAAHSRLTCFPTQLITFRLNPSDLIHLTHIQREIGLRPFISSSTPFHFLSTLSTFHLSLFTLHGFIKTHCKKGRISTGDFSKDKICLGGGSINCRKDLW